MAEVYELKETINKLNKDLSMIEGHLWPGKFKKRN